VVLKLKLRKNYFNKNCTPKFLLLNEKKIRKIQMIFYIEIHFESPMLVLRDGAAKLGKASWDAYKQGGWLIL
jgi:hypothetical protein